VRAAGGEDDGCQDGTGTRKEVGTRVGERARTVAETRMGDGTRTGQAPSLPGTMREALSIMWIKITCGICIICIVCITCCGCVACIIADLRVFLR